MGERIAEVLDVSQVRLSGRQACSMTCKGAQRSGRPSYKAHQTRGGIS